MPSLRGKVRFKIGPLGTFVECYKLGKEHLNTKQAVPVQEEVKKFKPRKEGRKKQ